VAQIVPLVVTLLGLSSPWPAAATGGPKVATHPRTGPPGRVVRVTGQGFGSREVVDLSFGRHALATTSTDASGSFRRKVQIPRRAHPGNHWISATGAASGGTATTPFLVDTDWPQFRGDPQHHGQNRHEHLLSTSTRSVELRWSFRSGFPFYLDSPVLADGVLYVGSDNRNLYALDAFTGAERWAFPAFNSGETPAVARGLVYAASNDGRLHALDVATGETRWVFGTGSFRFFNSPTVAGGTVYVGGGDTVFALDAATGTKRWSVHRRGSYASPAVVGGTVYVGAGDGKVLALDAATGAERWRFDTRAFVYSSPAVVDGVVYVGSGDGVVFAIDATTGAERWRFQTAGELNSVVESSPAVANGVVYIGSRDHNVYALEADTGAVRWAFRTGDFVLSSPAVANGVVYVGSDDRNVYALDAGTGARVWSFRTRGAIGSSPVVANGMVFVGAGPKVIALGPERPA